MTAEELIDQMQDRGTPISAAELAQIEERGNFLIPMPLAAILIRTNGGYVSLNYNGDDPKRSASIRTFFRLRELSVEELAGSDPEFDISSIPTLHDWWVGDWLHPDILPFAEDEGGNPVCIAFRGRHHGEIYKIEHEYGEMDDGRPIHPHRETSGQIRLAKNFEQFLSGLSPIDEQSY